MNVIGASLEVRQAMLDRPSGAQARALAAIVQHREAADAALEELRQDLSGVEGERRFEDMMAAKQAFWRVAGELLQEIEAGDDERAMEQLSRHVVPARNAFLEAVERQQTWQRKLLAEAVQAEVRSAKATESLLGLGLLVLLTAGSGLALWMSRRLQRALGGEPRDAVDAMHAIVEGDLSRPNVPRSSDQGRLIAALADVRRGHGRLVAQVRLGVGAVQNVAQDRVAGDDERARRTQAHQAELARASQAVSAIAAEMAANADKVSTVRAVSLSASQAAEAGE
jgi:methyl-accepting chemotaxis protein